MNILEKFRLANLSIRFKLIIGIVFILVIAMLSLAIVFTKQSENLLIKAMEGKAHLLNRNFSIVAAKGIQENTFSNLQALINEVAAKDQEIKVLVVAYANGIVIATSDQENFRQFSTIQNEYVIQQLDKKENRVTRNKSHHLLESIHFIHSQVNDEEMDDFYDDEETDDFYDNEDVDETEVDTPEPIISSPDKNHPIKDNPETRSPSHKSELLGFIYIALDTTHLEQSISNLWFYSIILACFIMGLGIVGAYWFAHTMSKPIAALAHEVHIITSGNLGNPIVATSQDEFGRLVSDVEKMRVSIKDLTENLEAKVEERTTQLAQANQQITRLNERLQAENIRLAAELDVAEKLQKMVLPTDSELKNIHKLDIAGFMEPADEVGGDYYDVLQSDGRVKIGIGDVTGHGLESGVLMLMVQMAIQTLLTTDISDPEAFLELVNRAIYNNIQRIGTDKNLTLSLLDYQEGHLCLTGQHEEVLVVRQGGYIERINTTDLGFMVGLVPSISNFVSHLDIQLQPGDGIVLYTDGITEARNVAEKLYGVERLCEVVSCNWHQTAKEIIKAVITDVRKYIGTQKIYDDITLLVLKQKS